MSFPFVPRVRQHGCGDPGAEIPFGCIFDGAQYLAWPSIGSQTDRKLWTVSVWVRRGKLGVMQSIFSTGVEGNGYDLHDLRFGSDDKIWFGLAYEVPKASFCSTVAVFRDPAAWLHIVAVFDSANAIPADRMRIYVNGERQTVTSTGTATYPIVQNTPGFIGNQQPIRVGNLQYFGAYLSATVAELDFVWGQGLGPEAFGYLNRFGIWVPKAYLGSYGIIGRRLAFADPLALGADTSGNALPFTTSGLTAANQVTDTPTHGYATLNPLVVLGATTYTGGNFIAATGTSAAACSTFATRNGVYYAEVAVNAIGTNLAIGVTTKPGASLFASGVGYYSTAQRLIDGATAAYGSTFTTGSVIGIKLDTVGRTVEFFKNGISQGSIALPSTSLPWFFAAMNGSSATNSTTWNFGQHAWAYPTNAGDALALSIANMPCPAIKKPDHYVTTRLASASAGVADLPWNPGTIKTMVLSHRQDAAADWRINFSDRSSRAFAPNLATGDFAEADGLTFTASGYTVGANAAYAGTRKDRIWRASRAAGFDIVYVDHVTGIPTTVPHAVGGPIDYAWVLPIGAGGNRRTYHRGLAAGQYYCLNGVNVYGTDAGWFTSTAVDLTLGASMPTGLYAIPAWRAVPGLSAFGVYTGNGAADGAFAPMDFAPRLVIGRRVDRATWIMEAGVNPVQTMEYPHSTSTPYTDAAYAMDFVSNGLKQRATDPSFNPASVAVAFAAWAKTPGKFTRAR